MPDIYAIDERKRDIQAALLNKIEELLADLDQPAEAETVRDLALAYRYVAGGNQPGSQILSK